VIVRFSLVEQTNIDFRKIAVGSSKLGVDNMINRVQTKDNIGVCLLLETKEAVWDVNSKFIINLRYLYTHSSRWLN